MRSFRAETEASWNKNDSLTNESQLNEPVTPEPKRRGRKPKVVEPGVTPEPTKGGNSVKKLEAKIERKIKQQAKRQKQSETLLAEIEKLRAMLGVATQEESQRKIDALTAELAALTAKRDGA